MDLGPVLGGWLVEHTSWHWIFFINLPLAVLVVLITVWHVPDSRSLNAQPVDWLGAAAATFGLAALVYGFLEATVAGWTPRVLGTLISGFLVVGLFVLI